MSALYSSNVSNSETSFANSSSNSGSCFSLIEFILTLKRADFPFNSSEWYSSGKITLTSTLSPIFLPINCSSKPGIKVCEPTTKS